MTAPLNASDPEDNLEPAPSAADRRASLLRTLSPPYPDREQLVASARAAVDQGLAVVPCWPRSSRPAGPPERGKWSFEHVIKAVGDCNVGVALGEAEGVFSVVADDEEALTRLELLDDDLPPDWRIRDGAGRVSVLLRSPKRYRIEARRLEDRRVTVVTHGVTLLPPSTMRKGACSWASEGRGPVVEAPAWLVDLVRKRAGVFDPSDDLQAWADLRARRAHAAREIAAASEAIVSASCDESGDFSDNRDPSAPVAAAVEKLGRVVQRHDCCRELGNLLARKLSGSSLGTFRESAVSAAFSRGTRGPNRPPEGDAE